MALRVSFRQRALADLRSIYLSIAADSPQSAIRVTREIRERCLSLADFPEQGPTRDDLSPGVRILPHKRATIAYRILPDRIQIIAILYGGRDIARLLGREQS